MDRPTTLVAFRSGPRLTLRREMAKLRRMERRYGLDWLRIGAFGLLIFYHIGMFFVPWDWHVKTAHPLVWAEIPMTALNPWRLPLLFLISGVASRVLFRKVGGAGTFARSRTVRLFVPLVFAMAVVVPPQPWVELQFKYGYTASLGHFWLNDYFRFGKLDGIALPTWQHLWFVAYLWVYTLLLALAAALLPARARASLQRAFDSLFAGGRMLALPILILWLFRMLLYPRFGETHALTDDWYAHAAYGFCFLFGVMLGGAGALWSDVERLWKPAALLAVAGYAGVVAYNLAFPENGPAAPDSVTGLARVARSLQEWSAIVALVGWANRHLHRDSPARRYFTEAIFPYYIAHQTIIVVTGWYLLPLNLGAGAEFAILLPVTALGCALTYELARRVPYLGPLLGLRRR